MLISHEYKMLFIHPAKCGGTSLRNTLKKQYKFEIIPEVGDLWHTHDIPEAYKDYQAFGPVRNPFARYVSWYANVMGNLKHPWRDDNKFVEILDGWGRCEFSVFLRYTLKRYTYMTPCHIMLPENAIIMKQETLDADFSNLPFVQKPTVLPRDNKWPHPPWQDCYTYELANLIREKYSGDFERFGYSKDFK